MGKGTEENKMEEEYGDLLNRDKLYDPIKSLEEKEKLVPAFLKLRGLFKLHIESYNHFVDQEMLKIIKAKVNNKIMSDVDPNFYLQYNNIRVGFPEIVQNFRTRKIMPLECRIANLTYAANIYVDIEYFLNDRLIKASDVVIGRMPIMLGSNHCYLKDMTVRDLTKIRECPYDPRGYFIIKGTEKVVLMQEQMSRNRILVEKDSKLSSIVSNCASVTLETKSRITVLLKNGKVYVKSNSFTEIMPVVILFKAMGYLQDQEIVQMIGIDSPYLIETMFLSFHDAVRYRINSQNDALKWVGERVRNPFKDGNYNKRSLINDARNVLANIILAHIKCKKFDFYPKFVYLALMVRKMLLAQGNPELCDDKDYYGNKRVEAAGQMLALLFEDLFKKFNSELKKEIDITIKKRKIKTVEYDITKLMNADSITHGLFNSLSSGNWVVKRFKVEKKGVTQVLNRLSYVAALGMMTRLESHIEKSRKVSGPRALQPSHWGMLCPSDTPDGENCGLVKALALLAHITTETPELPIFNLCLNLGMQEIGLFSGLEIQMKNVFLVFLNGQIVGAVNNIEKFIQRMKSYRRKGKVNEFISISYNKIGRFVNISCDYGRLTRPYIIVENGRSKLQQKHIDSVEKQEIDFNDLVKMGIIEYLDVNEEDNSFIALKEEEIKEKTTHVEIALYALIGLVAGVIPYPHHNQSPRNTYQCAMGKQAIGALALNQFWRTDTVIYLLVYPQKPLVKTKTIEIMKYDKMPAGHNASVAIMSYSGYDIEDAIIVNKGSLDRGFGRMIYRRRYQTEVLKYPNTMDRILGPAYIEDNRRNKAKRVIKKHKALDKDGIGRVGEKISSGEVYVNKETPNEVNSVYSTKAQDITFYPTPSVYKNPNPSRIDKVLLSQKQDVFLLIKTIMTQVRTPELGDKFSSRHGQKGVMGLYVDEADMPFSEQGWRPDLIMNPHGFPSRMTVGKLIELIGAKGSALEGRFSYGTPFGGDKVKDLAEVLVRNGFSYSGKDCLISGITGEYLKGYIFQGPIYYQRLKHLVADKIHARAIGKKTTLTRQPLEGRAKKGGLRLGEMERDCLIAYGTANLLLERLLYSSDVYQCGTCEICGNIVSSKISKTHCPICNKDSVYQVQMPYPCKLLFQELMAMNIRPKIEIR